MRTTEVAGFLYLENSTARDVEIRDNRIVLERQVHLNMDMV